MKQHMGNISVAVACVGFVAAGLLSTSVLAHHSFAMYDQTSTRTMTGKLVRLIPGGSHSQIVFDALTPDGQPVMDKEGKQARWQVELGSATNIARQGVTVKSLPGGTIITVTFYSQRDGRPQGAIAGPLVLCGTVMPTGGCSEQTGTVMKPPAN